MKLDLRLHLVQSHTMCEVCQYTMYVPAEWLGGFFHSFNCISDQCSEDTNHWTLWGGSTELTLATGLVIQTQSHEQIQQLQNSTYVMHMLYLEINWALWGLWLARPSAHKHLGNHMFVNQTKASWNLKSLFLSPQFNFHPHNKHTFLCICCIRICT